MSPTETWIGAERAAAGKLLPMIWGIHISRCVYAAAELGIADLLADGPRSSQELADATGTYEPSLYRVLRVLAALGVFEEHEARVFIPKPGRPAEQRPLSIPAVRDRVVQAATKIVIEPIFEADMLECSFGFRPRRSAHDARQVLID